MGTMGASTMASSLSRWGRLPVFSSCSITPTTISSSMPCVSTFVCPDSPPGDGGGVSAARPALLGRCSSMRNVVVRGGDVRDAREFECVRFTFFAGWVSASAVEGDVRAVLGRLIPSDGSDNDLRRVLYGILSQRFSRNNFGEIGTATPEEGIYYRAGRGVATKSCCWIDLMIGMQQDAAYTETRVMQGNLRCFCLHCCTRRVDDRLIWQRYSVMGREVRCSSAIPFTVSPPEQDT